MDRSFLHQRMPLGACFKIALVYDEPFWRADGLSGQSFAPGSPSNLNIDSCTDTGSPGVLPSSPRAVARQIGKLSADERKKASSMRSQKGSATKHVHPSTTSSRTGDRSYSGGAMIAHTPPGVLTEFGPALREPCRRIHWPEPKTSAKMYWVHRRSRPLRRARRDRG